MKKALVTIGLVLIAGLSWLFIERPHPPFLGSNPNQSQGPTYFAEIDSNGNVLRVIVVTQKVIDSGIFGDPKNWIQTYTDGSIRKNYASKGDKYDKNKDYFIPKDPGVAGETFDTVNAKWIVPTL